MRLSCTLEPEALNECSVRQKGVPLSVSITGLWSTIILSYFFPGPVTESDHYEIKVYTFFPGYFKAQIRALSTPKRLEPPEIH